MNHLSEPNREKADGDRSWTVQLLVDDEANAAALGQLLEERYAVRRAEELAGDLYVVDDRSIPVYQDRLEQLKGNSEPTFTPVVLIRRPGTRLRLAEFATSTSATAQSAPLVDEVVTAPVRREILFRRLENLFVRLEQFRRLAEQNERLEEFASVLSHDLRNPLQVATGRLALLEGSVPDSEREHLEAIDESLDRMDSLIEHMLELARDGTETTAVTELELESIVEEAWTVVESETATLVTAVEGATVEADRNRLLTLFENLFRNAFDHGGGSVRVTVSDHDAGFVVEDDGPGIPPDERDAVLEQGYSTGGDGAGLGLAIVSSIVDRHDWELVIGESDDGGARFVVETS